MKYNEQSSQCSRQTGSGLTIRVGLNAASGRHQRSRSRFSWVVRGGEFAGDSLADVVLEDQGDVVSGCHPLQQDLVAAKRPETVGSSCDGFDASPRHAAHVAKRHKLSLECATGCGHVRRCEGMSASKTLDNPRNERQYEKRDQRYDKKLHDSKYASNA